MIELAVPDTTDDGIGVGALPSSRLTYFFGEGSEVVVGRVERVATFELGAYGDLQELRGRKVTPLQLVIERVREIDLHTGHTPNCTPREMSGQGRPGESPVSPCRN